MLKLFISYAHKDEAYKDDLKAHLSGLLRSGTIQEWNDRKLLPGQSWDATIKRHLEESQIVLFLVSASFMASDYIHDVEIKRAMARHEKGEVVVIPIIVRPCLWQGLPMQKLQGLPTDARPISTWENEDEAYLNVVMGIKRVIDNLGQILVKKPSNDYSTSNVSNNSPSNSGSDSNSNSNNDFGGVAKKLIIKGKMEKAIDLLLEVAEEKDEELYSQLIAQSRRYHSATDSNVRWGRMSDENYQVALSQIQYALLGIIKDLEGVVNRPVSKSLFARFAGII